MSIVAMPPTFLEGQAFHSEASDALMRLRSRVALVLSDLGTFRRPADIQKAFDLDKTLGRQIFRIIQTPQVLEAGAAVPSRTSMRRFLEAAEKRGALHAKVEDVWTAYEGFERLVEKHAGDRVSFNSMVTAISADDDEWHVADAQHRRNAYRAMSHATGIQAKTKLSCIIVNMQRGGTTFDLAQLGGFVGLRVLRPHEAIRVHGFSANQNFADNVISLGDPLRGNLLPEFSSHPCPPLSVVAAHNHRNYRNVLLNNPQIGNTGTSNLFFGEAVTRLNPRSEDFVFQNTTRVPVELQLFDLLVRPDSLPPCKPSLRSYLGDAQSEGHFADNIPLQGNISVDILGQGPDALIAAEIPQYADMLAVVEQRLGWPLKEFQAWRIRVEFPLYQSTVRVSWPEPLPPVAPTNE